MRYPLCELLDRRAIILLYLENEEYSRDKPNHQKEFDEYTSAINDYIFDGFCNIEQVEEWHNDLYHVNREIWDLESEIRKGKENELGLEEVGRRAIMIRNINNKRVSLKNKITEMSGVGYKYSRVRGDN